MEYSKHVFWRLLAAYWLARSLVYTVAYRLSFAPASSLGAVAVTSVYDSAVIAAMYAMGFYVGWVNSAHDWPARKHLTRVGLAALGAVVGRIVLIDGLSRLTALPGLPPLSASVAMLPVFLFFIACTSVGVGYGFATYYRYKQHRLALWEDYEALATAELTALRNQLDPGFLIRTLKDIRAAALTDVATAERLLAHFSNVLRLKLKRSRGTKLSIREEVDLISGYLGVAKSRGDCSIDLTFDASQEDASAELTHPLLQPVVESLLNADLGQITGRGILDIAVVREGDITALSVVFRALRPYDSAPHSLPIADVVSYTRLRDTGVDPRERTRVLEVDVPGLRRTNRPAGEQFLPVQPLPGGGTPQRGIRALLPFWWRAVLVVLVVDLICFQAAGLLSTGRVRSVSRVFAVPLYRGLYWSGASLVLLWMAHHSSVAAISRLRGLAINVACVAIAAAGYAATRALIDGRGLQEGAPLIAAMFIDWLFIAFNLLMIGYALKFISSARSDERSQVSLRTQLAHVEVSVLKRQLEPHFLFNALNSVSALLHSDPPGAAAGLEKLERLLGTLFHSAPAEMTTLRQEMEFIAAYVGIEQMRMGSQLQVTFAVQTDLGDLPIPYLTLQPLVENAIKHGVARNPAGGTVMIRAERAPRGVRLSVEDTGAGVAVGSAPDGFGLGTRSIEARLRSHYGSAAEFTISSNSLGGTTAAIHLPAV